MLGMRLVVVEGLEAGLVILVGGTGIWPESVQLVLVEVEAAEVMIGLEALLEEGATIGLEAAVEELEGEAEAVTTVVSRGIMPRTVTQSENKSV